MMHRSLEIWRRGKLKRGHGIFVASIGRPIPTVGTEQDIRRLLSMSGFFRDFCHSKEQSMALGSTPAIAAIGIIGQHDEPLHIALFAPHEDDLVGISFLLNSSLDIFEIRLRQKSVEQDLGLLHAIDERMSTYGWLTNSGMKFIIAVDMMGKPPAEREAQSGTKSLPPILGLRDSDLKPAFRAIHAAYVELLMNPFYTPEDRTPMQVMSQTGKAAEITSSKFKTEMERIGRVWYPGIITI